MAQVTVERTTDRIALDNGALRLAFARDAGGAWRLAELRGASPEAANWVSTSAPLWRARLIHERYLPPDASSRSRWDLRATEEAIALDGLTAPAADCAVDVAEGADAATLTLRWEGITPTDDEAETLDVAVRVTLRADEPVSRWTASVSVRGVHLGLWELIFPVVGGLRGDEATRAILPDGWGVEVANPGAQGDLYRGRYPSGRCVMQLVTLSDAADCVYLAPEDARAFHKDLRVAGDGRGAVTYDVVQYPADMGDLRNAYETPYEGVIGVLPGGWEAAAKRYRAWALTAPWTSRGPLAARADVADWIKETAIWAQASSGPRRAMEEMVASIRDYAEYLEVPTAVHWYSWHEIPFDDHYPEYFPPKAGFAEGVRALQAAGVRVMPYINGRLWDPRTESWFTDGGARACCKTRDQSKYVETYASGAVLAAMCPSTQIWQHKIAGIVERLAGEYGVDGVYIDQIAAAPANLCFDRTHGHGAGGGDFWVRGYERLTQRAKDLGTAQNPDLALTTEDAAEPFAAQVDAFLMCNATREGLVPLFPMVYSGYLLTFGRYIFPGDADDPPAYRTKLGQIFLWGAQLGWMYPGLIQGPERAKEAAYTRALARIRYDYRSYLALGEMVAANAVADAPGALPVIRTRWHMMNPEHGFEVEPRVPIEMPAVGGTVWLRGPQADRYGVFLVNMGEEEVEVAWRAPMPDAQPKPTLGGAGELLETTADQSGARGRLRLPGLSAAVIELPRG